MPPQPATIADFKAYYVRDFTYGATIDTVLDADITKALDQAEFVFNAGLFDSVAQQRIAYLTAAAHFLVLDIRAAGGLGVSHGLQSYGDGVILNKSVGQVSLGYQFPDLPPMLEQFRRSGYGQNYLQIVLPRMVGNAQAVAGWDDTGAVGG